MTRLLLHKEGNILIKESAATLSSEGSKPLPIYSCQSKLMKRDLCAQQGHKKIKIAHIKTQPTEIPHLNAAVY